MHRTRFAGRRSLIAVAGLALLITSGCFYYPETVEDCPLGPDRAVVQACINEHMYVRLTGSVAWALTEDNTVGIWVGPYHQVTLAENAEILAYYFDDNTSIDTAAVDVQGGEFFTSAGSVITNIKYNQWEFHTQDAHGRIGIRVRDGGKAYITGTSVTSAGQAIRAAGGGNNLVWIHDFDGNNVIRGNQAVTSVPDANSTNALAISGSDIKGQQIPIVIEPNNGSGTARTFVHIAGNDIYDLSGSYAIFARPNPEVACVDVLSTAPLSLSTSRHPIDHLDWSISGNNAHSSNGWPKGQVTMTSGEAAVVGAQWASGTWTQNNLDPVVGCTS